MNRRLRGSAEAFIVYIIAFCSTFLHHRNKVSESMASTPNTRSSFYSGISPSDQWCLTVTTAVFFGIFLYIIYDAVMAAASEMLRRVLVISPLLLLIAVHWISSGLQFKIPIPGSEPESIHRAGGSPWGVASVLLLLYFLIWYQPSLLSLIF